MVPAGGKKIEIIFVSSDSDEDEFKEYYEDMPWTAVPFSADEVRWAWKHAQGLPSQMFSLLLFAGSRWSE